MEPEGFPVRLPSRGWFLRKASDPKPNKEIKMVEMYTALPSVMEKT